MAHLSRDKKYREKSKHCIHITGHFKPTFSNRNNFIQFHNTQKSCPMNYQIFLLISNAQITHRKNYSILFQIMKTTIRYSLAWTFFLYIIFSFKFTEDSTIIVEFQTIQTLRYSFDIMLIIPTGIVTYTQGSDITNSDFDFSTCTVIFCYRNFNILLI